MNQIKIVPVLSVWLILLCSLTTVNAQEKIGYKISMPEPHSHYFHVQLEIAGLNADTVELKMPVWAPGSYLVREFSRHVEDFSAKNPQGKALINYKSSKNTWKVIAKGSNKILVEYKVYAYEPSVRTSYLDASHGFIHGASLFMYLEGKTHLPVKLTIEPYNNWQVATGLKKSAENGFQFQASNYDELIDAPIEIGTHKIISFKVEGVTHEVAMYGKTEYNEKEIIRDLTRIIEKATEVFDHHPNDYYLFIVHNLDNRGGGLEHHNSTTLQVDRWSYTNTRGYQGFLALAAHEYFHLWWVKRARPIELGPFDYNQENYTTLLWAMEGFTSYYDDLLLKRAGIYNDNDYLNKLMGSINHIENQPGNAVQSVSMSSFDTWIKFYRPDENSSNSSISYYTKGAVLGALLDLEIINATKGAKKLDDALKYLYQKYYLKENRGFTEKEFQEALELTAGKSLDEFFRNYVYDVKAVDYNKFFNYAGLQITNTTSSTDPLVLGVSLSEDKGKVIVESITSGSSAHSGGINVNDEIIALDGFRANKALFEKVLATKKPGDHLKVLVSREGLIKELDVEIKPNSGKRFMLSRMHNSTPAQMKVYETWLGR